MNTPWPRGRAVFTPALASMPEPAR